MPALRAALEAHQMEGSTNGVLARQTKPRITSIMATTVSQCSTKSGTPDRKRASRIFFDALNIARERLALFRFGHRRNAD
jgi:hypothetical protein